MNFAKLYNISSNDKILIDTNILIYIFCPLYSQKFESKIDTYSTILQEIQKQNSKILLSSIVVSEFINRWLRLDFDKNIQDKEHSKNFKKDYRGTDRYNRVLKQILKQIEKLYVNYNIENINDSFDKFDIISSYEDKNNDFNDLLLAYISSSNNLKILTDDNDFDNLDIERV